MFSKPYRCHECGSSAGYRSRRRNFYEKYMLPIALLQPVRCIECYRRSNESIFRDVLDRPKVPPHRSAAA